VVGGGGEEGEEMKGYYNEIGFRLARSQTVFIKSAISSPPFQPLCSIPLSLSLFLTLFPPAPFFFVFLLLFTACEPCGSILG